MLADQSINPRSGALAPGVLHLGQSREAIVGFIRDQLKPWQLRMKGGKTSSETKLTAALCSHLNTAARKSAGWDTLQFKQEEPDETNASRTYDLAVSPREYQLDVEGRTFEDFEVIFPVECKRLPTPSDKRRDPREYVTTATGSGGAIQRYKEGKHGACHERAVVIGYVQDHTFAHWVSTIEGWIDDLATTGATGWSSADKLKPRASDSRGVEVAEYDSVHDRSGLQPIRLRHLWILM